MASPTFHPFSRLPCELRLQIWEAACFPSSRHCCGLHYIDVKHWRYEEPNLQNWVIPLQEQGFGGQADRSAYMWDGGLWKTCKESREVIKQHSHIDDWLRIQAHPDRKDSRLMVCKADWAGGEEAVPPGKLVQNCEEKCALMVYPARDMFCIKRNEWNPKGTLPPYMMIFAPFLRSGDSRSTLFVQNIALEFDSSWNSPFPKNIFYLGEEASSRGLLAKILLDISWNYDSRLESNFWVIDKSARWVRKPQQDLMTVYHDCDDEYVQVAWYDTRCESTQGGCYSEVTEFIKNLGTWADEDLDDFGRTEDSHWTTAVVGRVPLEVAKCVRLLVRRCNEVTKSTNLHDTSAD